MPTINSINFPDNSRAIILEPQECHNPAIIRYDAERDIAVYSERLFLMSLTHCQGMTPSEAMEWYTYNTLGTNMRNYPVFITEDGEEAL